MHEKYCMLHVQKLPPDDELASSKPLEENLIGIN
jgi:hypothetical protein